MLLEYFGLNSNFFTESFFTSTGFEVGLNSAPEVDRLEFINPETGLSVTFLGTGLSVDGDNIPDGGTITSMHFSAADGTDLASISGFNFDIVAFFTALSDAGIGDSTAIEAFFNAAPITVDATTATTGYDMSWVDISISAIALIKGSAFADVLNGGSDDDWIYGFDGDDTLNGSGGRDKLYGGEGSDTLTGGNGKDVLYGGNGDDLFIGGRGDDLIKGGNNSTFDNVSYQGDIAGVTVDLSNEVAIDGWGFTDTLVSIEVVGGSEFDDKILGDSGVNSLYGLGGKDILKGRGGADTLFGGNGADKLDGGNGSDYLFGGAGHDEIFAGAGNDTIDAGDGNDVINDGEGDDIVMGGKGNDTFLQNSGYDRFDGGAGIDTLYVDLSIFTLPVDFEGFWDLDAGIGGGVGSTVLADTILNIENVTVIGDFNFHLTGDDGNNVLISGGGNDVLAGGGGNDRLSGRSGNDTITGGTGEDTLIGKSGKDILRGGSGADTIIGGKGVDKLFGGNGNDTFVFEKQNDSLVNKADQIRDFEIGIDTLDFSTFSSVLTFIGAGGFTGAGNEVRATVNGSGDTLIRIDVDGDSSADMKIVLSDVTGLIGSDFNFV